MSSQPSSVAGSTLKAAFVVLAVWLAYQGLSARDFTAPSAFTGTAPVLR